MRTPLYSGITHQLHTNLFIGRERIPIVDVARQVVEAKKELQTVLSIDNGLLFGELSPVPCWHRTPKKPARPYWSKWIPSAAALSYNFAVDRYHPLVSKKGFLPTPFIDNQGNPKNFDWNPLEDEDLANNLKSVRVPNVTTARSRQYSYNISRGGTGHGGGYRSSTFI